MVQIQKIFIIAFIIYVGISTPGYGTPKPLLELDFAKPSWREILSGGGSAKVENGALRLKPGTYLISPMIPCNRGDKVIVSVEAQCQDVRPGKEGYQIGWTCIEQYDQFKQGCGHQDVVSIRDTVAWKTYQVMISFNDKIRYFQVYMSHAGSSGTVWYRNLKISVINQDQEDLIGDTGFEGTLGVDHWYFKKEGFDWDNLKLWSSQGSATVDALQAVSGKQSLTLAGTATLVSKEFTNRGETLILSGWLKSKSITAGVRGWCGGGVQLVGLGADGKHLVHQDLRIMFGDQPWTFFRLEQNFPASIKKYQVWLRMFDGAKGTLWLDEIRLQRIPLGKVRPFDSQKSQVTIRADKPEAGPIRHRVWAGVDIAYASYFFQKDLLECLPWLSRAGIEYIRMHEISNGLRIYESDDPKGNPIYNWKEFDQAFDIVVRKYRMVPVVTLETTPPALDRPGTRVGPSANVTAPKDFIKWGKYIEAIFEHAVERYGKNEVEKWLWEIWNEPGIPSQDGYYVGSVEDFVALAEQVYLAADRVEKKRGMNLMMGITSSGGPETPILKRLQALHKLDAIDHYSRHIYSGLCSSIRTFSDIIATMRQFEKEFPGMKHYQIGCTEWGCDSMTNPLVDQPWNASYVVKVVRVMMDAGLDYSTYFTAIDQSYWARSNPDIFIGFLGMFTRDELPIPKPVYNAFVFLNELKGGRRLELTAGNDPIDGLAVVMPDGTIRIVLTNYDEDTTRQPYETKTTIQITGRPGHKLAASRFWVTDNRYGNSYGAWLAMGKPKTNNPAAKKKLIEASAYKVLPPPQIIQRGDQITLEIMMPSPGIRFIELKETQP